MGKLYQFSASEVVAMLRAGEISIADTLDAIRERVDAVNGDVNALPTLCFERAYDRAAELQTQPLDARGELCGLPVTIKDLTPVAGVKTTFGSAIFKDYVPAVSAQLVERIEQRGGVIYAKSNTPEFGAGGVTFNDVFGITRNPHDPRCASGGSSGGAAASLASGCAWLSHGSDMAGSLRTPASFCGVTSLRPSPGIIRTDSEYLPFQVLGAEGPMARNVDDLALFADVMLNDNAAVMQNSVQASQQYPLSDLRVAVSRDLGICDIDADVSAGFDRFIAQLSTMAGEVVEAHPDLHDVHGVFDVLRANIFAVGLEQALETHPGVMKPELEWNIESGIALQSAQLREALRAQGQIVKRSARFMQDLDVLVCPAVSVASVDATLRYPGENQGVEVPEYYRWLAIAYATTVTSLPVITLPVGTLSNGLPFAVQLVGKPWGEAALFSLAKNIETVLALNLQPVDPSAKKDAALDQH